MSDFRAVKFGGDEQMGVGKRRTNTLSDIDEEQSHVGAKTKGGATGNDYRPPSTDSTNDKPIRSYTTHIPDIMKKRMI